MQPQAGLCDGRERHQVRQPVELAEHRAPHLLRRYRRVCALASAGSCAEQRTRQCLARTGTLKLGGQLGIAGSRPDQPNWPPEGLERSAERLGNTEAGQLLYGFVPRFVPRLTCRYPRGGAATNSSSAKSPEVYTAWCRRDMSRRRHPVRRLFTNEACHPRKILQRP